MTRSMKCFHCNEDFIWEGDHEGGEDDDYLVVSGFHCLNCNSWALVYYPNTEGQLSPDDESTPRISPWVN
jgi:hypothetical protein